MERARDRNENRRLSAYSLAGLKCVHFVGSVQHHLAGSAMACFSMDKVASPAKGRAPPPLPLAEQSSRKAPKVTDLTIVQGPRPPPPRRPAATGDVVVCLYKYPPCDVKFNVLLRRTAWGRCCRP